jgi:hypothetical protein
MLYLWESKYSLLLKSFCKINFKSNMFHIWADKIYPQKKTPQLLEKLMIQEEDKEIGNRFKQSFTSLNSSLVFWRTISSSLIQQRQICVCYFD